MYLGLGTSVLLELMTQVATIRFSLLVAAMGDRRQWVKPLVNSE